MLPSITKKIEIAANVAIVVVSCLLAIILIKTYLLSNSGHRLEERSNKTQMVRPPTVSSLNIDWRQNEQTLVLAASSSCHFCTESAPFYKRLAQSKGKTRFVAVLPQSIADGRKYLEKPGVPVDEIRQFSLEELGVNGTPTLMLVDTSGEVKKFWVGKLSPEQEGAVLNVLGTG